MVLENCFIFHLKILLTEIVKRFLLFEISGISQRGPMNSCLSIGESFWNQWCLESAV